METEKLGFAKKYHKRMVFTTIFQEKGLVGVIYSQTRLRLDGPIADGEVTVIEEFLRSGRLSDVEYDR